MSVLSEKESFSQSKTGVQQPDKNQTQSDELNYQWVLNLMCVHLHEQISFKKPNRNGPIRNKMDKNLMRSIRVHFRRAN